MSSSNPTGPGWLTWPGDSGTDASGRSSGAVRPLAEAPAAFSPEPRTPGKTIIQIGESG